jgi:hypothetical protein
MLSGHNEAAGEHMQIVAGCDFSALGRHASCAFRSQSATFTVAPGRPTRTIWLTAVSPLLADLAVECHGGSAALI